MPGKLYTPDKYYRSYRIQIAAKYSGFQLNLEPFVAGTTNKDADYLRKFPTGSAPAFESGDLHLFEVNAIAEFVGSQCDQLKGGSDAARQAEVRQWINWADGEVAPAMATWVYPCLGVSQFNKSNTDRARDTIMSALNVLNTHLASRTYLVGERISQADITCFCNMIPLMEHVLDPAARQKVPHVIRWFNTIAHQPQVVSVVTVNLCDKEAKYDGKKFNELHPKKGSGDGKKKEPKKAAAPAAAKPKAEPEKFLTAAEREALEAKEPKKEEKDPFKALPGSFDMDEFKRCISNNDELTVAIPFFWEKFDPENYSIWVCEYLYNDELSFDFMSLNLIGGMFQRLDRLRKHCYSTMALVEGPKKYSIVGLWFWKGQDLAFNLHTDLQIDYESFKWTKLDSADEATKKLVEMYWCDCHEKINDRPVVQRRVFK